MKKLPRENLPLLPQSGIIVGVAFVFAFLGTLVWVNGRGTWLWMRTVSLPSFAPSLTVAYTLWLISYGLLGAWLLISALCFLRGEKREAVNVGLLLLSYLLSLLWHALFYSAWLVFPALIVIVVAELALLAALIREVPGSPRILLLGVPIFAIQAYFTVVNGAMM